METKRQIYDSSNFLFPMDETIDLAVKRVKEAYGFSEHLGLGKLYVCFSSGKDSVAVYGICKLAFGNEMLDKCEFHYNVTGIDHPELVYFIRREFPFVQRDMYDKSMWKLVVQKGIPPTRLMRYCCQELKERGGEGRFILTGVRWAESVRRRNTRGIFEDNGRTVKDKRILNVDNDDDRRELEHCIPKRKYICNPIVDWNDEEVWRFIVEYNIPYCKLYDEGWKRLGCIGCPMSSRQEKDFECYPKFKAQWIRTFDRMLEARREKGLKTEWKTGQEVYDWWISK